MKLVFRIFFLLTGLIVFGSLQGTQYDIPSSLRFSLPREGSECPLVYYFNQPDRDSYPILIMCEGSSRKGSLQTVFPIYKEFEERIGAFEDGYLAVEKWGIDGNLVDEKEFWDHYSWSQRIKDHLQVIHYLEENPPPGWNGKLIFVGGSEGGVLVTDLTLACPNTLATINWVGAADECSDDELWQFFEHAKKSSFWMRLYSQLPRWCPYALDLPYTREEFDHLVQEIRQDPSPEKWVGGLSYLYFADALQRAPIDYTKLKAPFLVVEGTEDSALLSCDLFVQKAKEAGAPITYFRVEGMGHEIRERPDVIEASFAWLREVLQENS